MKNPIRITFLGPQKAGKSSIINSLFKGMKVHETSTLESTLVLEKENLILGEDIMVEITEIPGSFSINDFQQEDGYLYLKDQDIFIYVLSCQVYSPEQELDDLCKIYDIINEKNKSCWFYIFYHQVDLEMFINNKIYQQDAYFEKNFNSYITKNISNSKNKTYYFLRTSLYEKTAQFRVSEILTKFIKEKSDKITKLIKKINISTGSINIYIFDLEKKLFLYTSTQKYDESKI